MGVHDLGEPLQVLDLAMPGELTCPVGQPLHYVVLEFSKPGKIDLRLAEVDAPVLGLPGFLDELGDMKERFRRNAAAIDAHAARMRCGIDKCGGEAKIGRKKGGRVPAWTAPDDDELHGNHVSNDFHEGTKITKVTNIILYKKFFGRFVFFVTS